MVKASLWKKSHAWEKAHSNDYEIWSQESDWIHSEGDRAFAISKTDPEAAFHIRLALADGGSVWWMQGVARSYDMGWGVTADYTKAQEYYNRAIDGGLWVATISYAQFLAKHGHYDHCETVLEDGVNKEFVPAYFWLAWYRYKQSRSRKTRRVIRPLVEHAAEQGHPGAQWFKVKLMFFGKFGFREVPHAFKFAQILNRQLSETDQPEEN